MTTFLSQKFIARFTYPRANARTCRKLEEKKDTLARDPQREVKAHGSPVRRRKSLSSIPYPWNRRISKDRKLGWFVADGQIESRHGQQDPEKGKRLFARLKQRKTFLLYRLLTKQPDAQDTCLVDKRRVTSLQLIIYRPLITSISFIHHICNYIYNSHNSYCYFHFLSRSYLAEWTGRFNWENSRESVRDSPTFTGREQTAQERARSAFELTSFHQFITLPTQVNKSLHRHPFIPSISRDLRRLVSTSSSLSPTQQTVALD